MESPSLAATIELHLIAEDEPITALDLLAGATELSRQTLKQAMQKGCVWHTPAGKSNPDDKRQFSRHTRRLRRAKKMLSTGDQLHLYYNPSILAVEPPTAQLIEDAGDWSVWFKPYGMLSQGSKWSDHCTLSRWAEIHLQPQRPAFIVHRLDRATSGLMVLAHSKKTAAALSRAFEQRETQKHYKAVVTGEFTPSSTTCETPIDGRSACSHFKRQSYDSQKQHSLVDVTIETGRKHQIRRHLSQLGYPIIGDRLYGTANESSPDLQLCAYQLGFTCPTTKSPKAFTLAKDLWPPTK